MAMPTRSARTTGFGEKVPTPAEIGPGSYLGPMEFTKLRPSLTAFASSQHLSWQGKQSSLGPGPGAYDGPIPRNCLGNDGRPSFCFESRAPRLAHQYTGSTPFSPSTVVDVPGPGAYETNTAPGGKLQRRFKLRKPRHKNTSDNLLNRFNPPSVPRKDKNFGYNVDPHGKLSALPAPFLMRSGDPADCVGPGDYELQRKEWWAGVGAAKFSQGPRKTVFDEEWVVKDKRPGPGDYNPKLRPSYRLEMQGSSPFMSGVPRVSADLKRSQTSPGPGQYSAYRSLGANKFAVNVPGFDRGNHRGSWLRSEKASESLPYSKNLTNLILRCGYQTTFKIFPLNPLVECDTILFCPSKCPYSAPEAGNIPGPGAYGSFEGISSFRKATQKTLTEEQIGFSSTEKRPSPGITSQNARIPGPGDYDLGLQSIAGGLKYKSRIGCKGVFGSSSDRFKVHERNKDATNQTPMQLWDQGKSLKRVVVLRPAAKTTSSFKSETCRFRGQSDVTPPPTQYPRKDSFDAIVERAAKSKSKPFLSTSDRREGGAFEVKDSSRIPGPGAYNITAAKIGLPPPRSRAQAKPTLPQGARFATIVARTENTVGPGSHDIAGSLIKKTFNITFNGACTPAGVGRAIHRVFRIQKPEESGLTAVVADNPAKEAEAPSNLQGIPTSVEPPVSMESVHPILANALNSLQQGNTDEAEKAFAEAAAACLQEFGEVNIVTARTLAHLARVRASRDKVDLAVDMYEKILRIHEALPEPCSSDHVIALLELAELQAKRGVHAAATDLRNKADCIIAELQTRMEAAEEKREASSSSTDSTSDEESDSSSDGISDDEKSDGDDELGHDVSET